MIVSPTFPLAAGWAFGDNGGKSPVTLTSPEKGTLRVAPKVKTDTDWHQQLNRERLSIEKGKLYTLSFEARATAPRPLNINLATLEGGWKSLGLTKHAKLTPEWKPYTYRFTATAGSAVGKLAFDLGELPL